MNTESTGNASTSDLPTTQRGGKHLLPQLKILRKFVFCRTKGLNGPSLPASCFQANQFVFIFGSFLVFRLPHFDTSISAKCQRVCDVQNSDEMGRKRTSMPYPVWGIPGDLCSQLTFSYTVDSPTSSRTPVFQMEPLTDPHTWFNIFTFVTIDEDVETFQLRSDLISCAYLHWPRIPKQTYNFVLQFELVAPNISLEKVRARFILFASCKDEVPNPGRDFIGKGSNMSFYPWVQVKCKATGKRMTCPGAGPGGLLSRGGGKAPPPAKPAKHPL